MTARVRAGDYADPAAYARALGSEDAVVEEDTLGSFDVVFLRYNPIREGEGRPGAPLIDFGWRLRLAGTLVINDPGGDAPRRQPDVPGRLPRRRPHPHAGVALEDAPQGLLAGARWAGGAQAAGAARRGARLLPAAPPGLEPQPDDRRR